MQDPVKNVSLLRRHLASQIIHGSPEKVRAAREKQTMWLGSASGGSDHVPFIHHLGIPSLFVVMSGDETAELSHTSYDHVESYEQYLDPGFRYGPTMAQTNGRLMMRLANADILPFDPVSFAGTMERSLEAVKNKLEELRSETEEQNQRLTEGSLEIAANPNLPIYLPEKQPTVPELDFRPLQNAADRLRTTAELYRRNVDQLLSKAEVIPDFAMRVNAMLIQLEQSLLREDGLPDRAWYRHQIWAPGINTGYQGFAFPGIHEALVVRDWKTAQEQIPVVAEALNSFTATLEKANALLAP